MAAAVYVLCALTSVLCAVLLLRSWAATRQRLALWTGVGFAGLAVNNVLLVADLVLFPDVDLQVLRDASHLAAVSVILAGLIWETR